MKKNNLIMSPNIFRFFFSHKPNNYNSKFHKSTLFINIKVMKIMFVCHPHHNKSK